MFKRKKAGFWIAICVLVVVVGVIVWRVRIIASPADGHYSARRDAPGMTVGVVRATHRAVPLVIKAAGTVQTLHTVAVKAQVGGTLEKVLFNEGDEVKTGQLLFEIDPEPFKIAVAQNEGQLEQDQAKLASDTANAQRMSKLIGKGFVSEQDYQNAQALVGQDNGLIAVDKAKLAAAKLQLAYTKIYAPISGKTGRIALKAGNLVEANGTTPLVTINQIEPIQVQFDIAQSSIGQLFAHRNNPAMKVAVLGPAHRLQANNGKVVFIDNTINQQAGTLAVAAQFPNAGHNLWPGELVTVELTLGVDENALTIPAIAVQPGQNGNYVYTVSDGHVLVKNVKVAREYAGYAVIDGGLAAGDIVVAQVPRQLHEGLAVRTRLLPAIASTLAAPAVTSAAAPRAQ
ncbi:MAG: efflux RND transporter periplasmic adaptor subunit [Gammaproteobacteria bacterium]